jgi:hypothetical protein
VENLGDLVDLLVLGDGLVAEMGVGHVFCQFDLVALYKAHPGQRREAGWAGVAQFCNKFQKCTTFLINCIY